MEKHLRHLPKTQKNDTCLNCNHILENDDNFCPRCGQLNDKRRLSFGDMMRETLGDFLAFDSRLSNSIKPLLTKPAQLAKDYIKGERASHIHPIRMYLIVSFVYFLLASFTDWKENIYSKNDDDDNIEVSDSNKEIKKNIEINDEENDDTYSFSVSMGDSKSNKDSNQSLFSTIGNTDTVISKELIDKAKISKLHFLNLVILDNNLNKNNGINSFFRNYKLEDTYVNRFLYSRGKEYASITFKDLSKEFSRKLPVIIFFFLPLFAIFLNLIHFKKDILYFEHLIFTFYMQSLYFILLGISSLAVIFYSDIESFVKVLANIIFLGYLYKSLRLFYSYKSTTAASIMFIFINISFLSMMIIYLLASIFTIVLIY